MLLFLESSVCLLWCFRIIAVIFCYLFCHYTTQNVTFMLYNMYNCLLKKMTSWIRKIWGALTYLLVNRSSSLAWSSEGLPSSNPGCVCSSLQRVARGSLLQQARDLESPAWSEEQFWYVAVPLQVFFEQVASPAVQQRFSVDVSYTTLWSWVDMSGFHAHLSSNFPLNYNHWAEREKWRIATEQVDSFQTHSTLYRH